MDNLAHTLVGAALGRAVADGRAPHAALVGAVAANAPDWAEFFIGFRWRRLDYYTLHRGITHSLLGAAVETAGLTLLIGLGALWWARRRGTPAPAWRWIALCVGATVVSHLVMDWQGSYGLRPWLPWSGRWYYGDTVAIVDPFFWLIPLVALGWGARRHWLPLALVVAVGVPITVVVLHADQAGPGLKVVFAALCVVAGVGWTRHWFGVVGRRRAAATALIALTGYALAQGLASLPAKAAARRAAIVRFGPGAQWAALTVVGRPFSWEPIYASADTVAGDDWALPRHLNDPRVQDALQHTSEGRAMVQFARFLTAEVDTGPRGRGMLVLLRDARYTRVARAGWAVVVIRMAGGGGGGRMTKPATTTTPDTPPVDLLTGLSEALEPVFRLEHLVALSRERALYQAWDRMLKRFVALRVHLSPDSPGRAWFLRETETLAALDHPTIRHAYHAALMGPFAYRTANWIDGESLAAAIRRGPRPIPAVMSLVRDLLGALEHAHARGIIMRRITPTTLMLDLAGRAIITDLRYANWCLAHVPAGDGAGTEAFSAPEVRSGGAGEPASDVYGVGAIVYYALTAQEPAPDPAAVTPPRQLRPPIPAVMERVVLRALQARPTDRYYTATEMLEDFVTDAGVFHAPAAEPHLAESGFERRLRRALGDDYELLEEIGAGGFGRVYRARDLGLERDVAIKVLHPSLTADPGVVERFRREAQLAARLRHPNIVSIYDIAGRAGLQWYTMELVPGLSLAQLVQQQGPLPVDRVVRLLGEALSALELAHTLGLVHRDLKPENMLLEPDGRLRITDFGLALALRGERFGGASSRSGTPQFAAPEQLLGERVDQRADLYSLAAVGYYALLGRPPFEGMTPEVVLAKQTAGVLPSLQGERRDVPRELEELLRHAIASEPGRRFLTAQAFREALQRATGGFLRRLWSVLQGK